MQPSQSPVSEQPASPTAPIDPVSPGSQPSPQTPPPDTSPRKPRTKRLLIIATIIALAGILIAAILILTHKQANPLKTLNPEQTGFTVRGKPYVYPCAVLSRDELAPIFQLDKDSAEIAQTAAINIDHKKGFSDVLDINGEGEADSSCNYGYLSDDGKEAYSSISVTAYQNYSHSAAMDHLSELKPKDTKPLTSLDQKKNPNYMVITTSYDGQDHDQPRGSFAFVDDNTVYYVDTYLSSPQNTAAYTKQLNTVAAQALQRIKTGKAYTMPSYSSPSIQNASLNTCQGINGPKLAAALGGVEFNVTNVSTSRLYEAVSNKVTNLPSIESYCAIKFRTQADGAAAVGKKLDFKKDDTGLIVNPHDQLYTQQITLRQIAFKSPEDARLSLEKLKQAKTQPTANGTTLPPLIDVANLGEAAARDHYENGTRGSTDTYTIVSGSFNYEIMILSKKQTDPFVSNGFTITDDIARQVFDLIKS